MPGVKIVEEEKVPETDDVEKTMESMIELDGEVLFDTAAHVDVLPEHRRIGYVFQDARLFPHLRVAANLRYAATRAAARALPATVTAFGSMATGRGTNAPGPLAATVQSP